MGERTERFEREFAASIGVGHAVALSSCTAALHLACLAAGVGHGDEVIVPSMTFAATANAVRYTGAVPDLRRHRLRGRSRASTSIMSRPLINERTKARHPGPLRRLLRSRSTVWRSCASDAGPGADRGRRPRSERPAQRRGRAKLGSFGLAGCFSFFPNKVLGVGEGGALVTDSDGGRRAGQAPALAGHDGGLDRPATAGRRSATTCTSAATTTASTIPGRPSCSPGFTGSSRSWSSAAPSSRATASCSPTPRTFSIPYSDFDLDCSSCYLMGVLAPDADARRAMRDAPRRRPRGADDHVPRRPPLHGIRARRTAIASLPRTERVAEGLFSIPLFPHMTAAQQDRVADGLLESIGNGGRMTWRLPLGDVRLSEPVIEAVDGGPAQQLADDGTADRGARAASSPRAREWPTAVAVSSGTAALHLAGLAAGVGPGDEVIVPAVGFVADAHVAHWCGGRTVFADVESVDRAAARRGGRRGAHQRADQGRDRRSTCSAIGCEIDELAGPLRRPRNRADRGLLRGGGRNVRRRRSGRHEVARRLLQLLREDAATGRRGRDRRDRRRSGRPHGSGCCARTR